MANRGGITYEPCTLVYTLLDESALPFSDFFLIVRSLHSFMVEGITPNEDLANVHVKLSYQASTINAIAKLGDLQHVIAVTKLSAYIKENEISRLDSLRRQFNISATSADNEQPATPKRRGAGKRPTTQVVHQRQTPYSKTQAARRPCSIAPLMSSQREREEDHSDQDYAGHDPRD